MKQIIINIFVFCFLLSCKGNNNSVYQNGTPNFDSICTLPQLVKEFYLDTNKTAKLEIYRNEIDNYILLQTKWESNILSISGEGNIDFANGILRLDTICFEKGRQIFILPAYTYGSTYGAEVYFLIYENDYKNAWYIFKIPFDRLEIKVGNNNLSYILRHMPNGKTIKYIFKDEILHQFQ
jgi:hypothetical protein